MCGKRRACMGRLTTALGALNARPIASSDRAGGRTTARTLCADALRRKQQPGGRSEGQAAMCNGTARACAEILPDSVCDGSNTCTRLISEAAHTCHDLLGRWWRIGATTCGSCDVTQRDRRVLPPGAVHNLLPAEQISFVTHTPPYLGPVGAARRTPTTPTRGAPPFTFHPDACAWHC